MMASIRARFLIVSAVSVTLVLSLAAWFFVSLFSANLSARIDSELTGHLNLLAGTLEFDPDGQLKKPDGPRDNRFYLAYGGLYWQIIDPSTGQQIRSASLFDTALDLPADHHDAGTIHRYRLKGPEGRDVIVQERQLLVATPKGSREIRIAVAIDAASLDQASSDFARTILPYVAALGLFLVVMSVLQLTIGLRPLSAMTEAVDAMKNRSASRLEGPFAAELAPLANALNALVDAQTHAMDKARARAADLAHGLKTPLTVITNHALTLSEEGRPDLAAELDMLAGTMLAHVNHELARTRIAQSADQRRSDGDLAIIASQIIRTLKHTEAGERLTIAAELPASLPLPVDPHDLRELIGNLMENACKWAGSEVRLTAVRAGDHWVVMIEDDGPGVPDDKLGTLTRRGNRLDETTPGTGLGLAIVSEIASVYTITLTFENRPGGGLRASLMFPARNGAMQ